MDLHDDKKREYGIISTGNLIRLSDIYQNPCGTEEFVEVSDEVMLFLAECRKKEYRDYSRDYRNVAPISFTERELGEVYHVFSPGADESYFTKLLSDELYAAMRQLKPEAARRFYLYHAEGLTMKRIAEVEGVSQYAVSKSIKRATLQLRRLLCNTDEENPYT